MENEIFHYTSINKTSCARILCFASCAGRATWRNITQMFAEHNMLEGDYVSFLYTRVYIYQAVLWFDGTAECPSWPLELWGHRGEIIKDMYVR